MLKISPLAHSGVQGVWFIDHPIFNETPPLELFHNNNGTLKTLCSPATRSHHIPPLRATSLRYHRYSLSVPLSSSPLLPTPKHPILQPPLPSPSSPNPFHEIPKKRHINMPHHIFPPLRCFPTLDSYSPSHNAAIRRIFKVNRQVVDKTHYMASRPPRFQKHVDPDPAA